MLAVDELTSEPKAREEGAAIVAVIGEISTSVFSFREGLGRAVLSIFDIILLCEDGTNR